MRELGVMGVLYGLRDIEKAYCNENNKNGVCDCPFGTSYKDCLMLECQAKILDELMPGWDYVGC